MPKRIRAYLDVFVRENSNAGKITLASTLAVAVVVVTTFGAFFVHAANNVQTSVTVLNVPPVWTVNAREDVASATSTPTESGYTLQWKATGTDSNGDQYYLLICKTGAAATANTAAPPTCNGGGTNQWTVSPITNSGSVATAATTTKETFPFNNESNDWYAYICDSVASYPSCSLTYTQGDPTDSPAHSGAGTGYPDSNSPFVINHPPAFSLVVNDSPVAPSETMTWTATATDTDVIRGGDTVRLFVCKAADYATSTCGAGGTWAASTFASFDPATTTTITIPTQDKTYAAYVYIEDSADRQATSTYQGFNSSFVVTNATPTVSNMSLTQATTSGDIRLFRPHATSGPYTVTFSVTDNNSCLNASSGNEIVSATTSIYRSGIGQGSCQTALNANTNSCYVSSANDPGTPIVCRQDVGSCSGSSDSISTWTCTFSLWYNADATDLGSFYAAENWLASVQVVDDNYATSSITEVGAGNELDQFLAFDVSTTSVAYGGLQPGQENATLTQTTNLLAYGNVGLDESLYGDTMCTNWTIADSCDSGHTSADSIPVGNQKAATSSVLFGDAFAYALTASTSPLSVAIHVNKTLASSTPQTKDTYWGIHVPIAITTSGAYRGQNTITAVTSNSSFW